MLGSSGGLTFNLAQNVWGIPGFWEGAASSTKGRQSVVLC